MDPSNELPTKGRSRRDFLTGAGAVGAAGALAGCSSSLLTGITPSTAPAATAYDDTDILNFALNLEYLEAEFFLRAATGSGLTGADVGSSPGAVIGGMQVTGLSAGQQAIVNEIAFAEQQHVRFLRATLGAAAVSRPAIDLTNSFHALAAAAQIGPSFNPYASFDAFLVGAFLFEDVGVTAYLGAAPRISINGILEGLLNAVAGIQATEAYHAATIRTILTANAIADPTYVYLNYANKLATLRASLGGGMETLLTVPGETTSATFVPTPSGIVAATSTNAIGYARTTDQVLHIVYGSLSNLADATTSGAGVAQGAFFPSGLNGNIKVTQS